MSLYNLVHGTNPLAPALLAMLNVKVDEIPRFRDCYFRDDHVIIYTRTGGANRSGYEAGNKFLTLVDGYVKDEDDSFDSTYALFYYRVPEAYHLLMDKLRSMAMTETQEERWQAVFQRINDNAAGDPMVARMTAAFHPIFAKIESSLGSAGDD